MPESDNRQCRAADLNIEAGFHWSRERYGPPPGIPKPSLAKIETQTDEEFFCWFLRWSPEEQESLMVGERYRRRTFNAGGWPSHSPVDVNELAAEGFFWTGQNDRVRCAFCAGFLGNWERGDPPIIHQHRRFFPHCKRAQRKPCPNIPIPPPEQRGDETTPLDIHTPIGGPRNNNAAIKADAVITNSDRPTAIALTNLPQYNIFKVEGDRLKSFKNWKPPPTFNDVINPSITPYTLSEAGFFYEGPRDKVRCFWCDGGLEDWLPNDDAWTEHASWYPGCRYVFLLKGGDFIANALLTLSDEERQLAANINYNNAGLDFLHRQNDDPTYRIRQQDWYTVLNGLGFENVELEELARAHNFHLESFDITSIVDALLARRANDLSDQQLTTVMNTEDNVNILLNDLNSLNISNNTLDDPHLQKLNTNAKAAINQRLPTLIDLSLYLNETNPPNDGFTPLQRDCLVAAANKCIKCNTLPRDTVTLPCGHLIYCYNCVAFTTPDTCYTCHHSLTGTCRVFFA
jgi:hypothetical protein